jgi:hypothetical protein
MFKDLINKSKYPIDISKGGDLKIRYVCSIIMEFIRVISEIGIPL